MLPLTVQEFLAVHPVIAKAKLKKKKKMEDEQPEQEREQSEVTMSCDVT